MGAICYCPKNHPWLSLSHAWPCVVRAYHARADRFEVDVTFTRCGEVERASLASSCLRGRLRPGEYLAALRAAEALAADGPHACVAA